MKKKMIFICSILVITTAFIIGQTPFTEHKSKTKLNIGSSNSQLSQKVDKYFHKDTAKSKFDDLNGSLNCKTCHIGEYPTKNSPELAPCPREGMISVYHRPEEGPEVVLLNEVANTYEPVIFSHKLHAQMAEMGSSCNGCHHYNTTGPVLPCRQCHSQTRKRDNVSIPDLRAAYHRQCMNCHRQWNYTTGCSNTCHFPKDSKTKEKIKVEVAKIKGKEHPPLEVPIKLRYQTNYEKGKLVTFYHDEHVNLFKLPCTACHQDYNCKKCHDKQHLFNNNDPEFVKPITLKKSLDEHHKPCFGCHAEENNKAKCDKCHKNAEMDKFNHSITTGWALNKYHNVLACTKCHSNNQPYKKLDNTCTSCHKNFKPGGFDHKVVGFVMSENHKDLECENCHMDKKDFTKRIECSTCHDDKQYPQSRPGKQQIAVKSKK